MCDMLTYVRIALATTDVQSILEVPVTDEINIADQTCLTKPNTIVTMIYTTRKTINRRKRLSLNHVVPDWPMIEE